MAGIRITLKETGQQSIARLWVHTPPESKKKEEPDYLIHFRRPEDYYGEFGFDWMDSNYKSNIIKEFQYGNETKNLNDYESLKKEYYDCEKNEKVELSKNKEYFVPWLSIFPKQEDDKLKQEDDKLKQEVKLKIEVEKLNNYQIQDDDYIEIPSKAGISFNPDKIKVSEINENTTIEVICKKPLVNDICVSVLDKNKQEVGKLNVIKNNDNYHLSIQLVKIIANKGNDIANQEIFKNFSPYEVKVIQEELQKYYNQPLIHLKFLPIKDLTIDIDKFRKNGVLSFDQDKAGNISLLRVLDNFEKEIFNEYFKGFKGIVVFLSSIFKNNLNAGHAKIYPLDNHYLFISPYLVGDVDKRSLVITHEIGHTLGLDHSSEMSSYFLNKKMIEKSVEKLENVSYNGRTYTREQYIKVKLKELEKVVPKFLFNYSTNDNIMEKDNNITQKSFWRWQWLKMQEELNLYYNEK